MQDRQRLTLKEPSIYHLRIQGILNESWGDYFGGEIVSTKKVENQFPVSTLRTPPMDQATLVGLISQLNGMGLRLLLVEQLYVEEDPSTVDNRQ